MALFVRSNRPSMAISAIRSAMVRNLTENREGQSGPLRVVGQSPEWRQVLRKATQVAWTDTTLFLQGESGTGKEARALHSPRLAAEARPLRRDQLRRAPGAAVRSELFGYERGAFTGAQQAKAGH